MPIQIDISADVEARVAGIAARSNLSAASVVMDALANGHSLAWQEQFIDKVAAGIAAADRGEFASQAALDLVLNKYRPA